MKNKVFETVAATLLATLTAQPVMAALPTMPALTGVADGDYLGMIQGIFNRGYDTGSLLIGAGVFLVVVIAVVIAFWDYHKGKRDLGDVGVVAAAGGLVMTVVIMLLQKGGAVI